MKPNDVIRRAQIVIAKYDGDNDTMPGLPIVSFTEFQLLEMVVDLSKAVIRLEEAIGNLDPDWELKLEA